MSQPAQDEKVRHSDGRRAATDAERKALASVLRLRILRMCRYEPMTNRQIAERLQRNPATVLHHVRTLVANGFLRAEQPRRGARGSREVPYTATGKSWELDGTVDGTANLLLRTFFAEVAQIPESDLDATRLGLQLNAEHEEELRDRLADLFNEFAQRDNDPGGRRLSLFFAIHPEVN